MSTDAELREALMALIETDGAFLKKDTKIKRVQEDRRHDLGAIVTTSMVAVADLRALLATHPAPTVDESLDIGLAARACADMLDALCDEADSEGVEELSVEWLRGRAALRRTIASSAPAVVCSPAAKRTEQNIPAPTVGDAAGLTLADNLTIDEPEYVLPSGTAEQRATALERLLEQVCAQRDEARALAAAPVTVTDEMVERAMAGYFESAPEGCRGIEFVAEHIKERARPRFRAALSAALNPEGGGA